jgi:hypothetical protein
MATGSEVFMGIDRTLADMEARRFGCDRKRLRRQAGILDRQRSALKAQ